MEKMDINKYIKSKKKVIIFNLVKNKEIEKTLDLNIYTTFYTLNNVKDHLTTEELIVFIIESKKLTDHSFFKSIHGLNNIVLYAIDIESCQKNDVLYKNTLFSYGYKYHGLTKDDKAEVFIYDIADYKNKPDWLNNKNWANPELWEK